MTLSPSEAIRYAELNGDERFLEGIEIGKQIRQDEDGGMDYLRSRIDELEADASDAEDREMQLQDEIDRLKYVLRAVAEKVAPQIKELLLKAAAETPSESETDEQIEAITP